jgi:teichuronic acid biosynthesis glycosyltransferase TuaG
MNLIDNQTVSVVIPCKNAEKYIEKCLDSVLNQSWKNIEAIVVDDGSTDGTAQILKKFGDRIRVVQNDTSIGSGPSRNMGMMVATGRYYAFCDADDVWYKQKIESQLEVMRIEKIGVCCTSYDLIDQDGNVIRGVLMPAAKIDKVSLERFGNSVICSTVIIDRNICGLQFFSNHLVEDYLLWMRITNGYGAIGVCNEKLAGYRIVQGSKSNNKLKMMAMHWNVLRGWCHFGIFKSSWYFANYCYRCAKKYGMKKSIKMAV